MTISSLLLIFITGLTTGGLSCVALQGGLLASVIANQKVGGKTSPGRQSEWLPIGMFLASKLVAHVILGFLLGWLGARLTLSIELRLVFQTLTALFMLGTALNLLEVHPIFRYLAFQPPRFVQKLVRKSSKLGSLFAPGLLGVLTVLIPCGVTQAMEVLAINSGQPIAGALIMFAFVLGTLPLFAAVGLATTKLSTGWHRKITRITAAVLIVMAIYALNGVLVVIDSPVTLQKLTRPVTWFFSEERFDRSTVQVEDGVQNVTISIHNEGYSPRYIKVKKNIPVNLTLTSKDAYSCALSFRLNEFGIRTFLEATDTQSFTFTPTKTGKYTFTCSMGMYSGILEVL